jgi:hypothetical protein
MEHFELLTVEERFQLTRRGLIIIPDFSAPAGKWTNCSETVVVIRPDGREFETTAKFTLTHFNIPDPAVPVDKRWRIVISLPYSTKEETPIGSRVFVSRDVRDALLK